MILWTIQHFEAWKVAQRAGVLRASEEHSQATDRDTASIFRPAYEWIITEMRRRVGEPPPGVLYPLWAWAQCGNSHAPKPDLTEPGHLPPGTPGICIEFEMPGDHVLLSDFDLWHFVFGQNTYIPSTIEVIELPDEFSAIDQHVYSAEEIRASWNRIFDLDFAAHDVAFPRAQKWIQAVMWEMPLRSVRVVDAFIAR